MKKKNEIFYFSFMEKITESGWLKVILKLLTQNTKINEYIFSIF